MATVEGEARGGKAVRERNVCTTTGMEWIGCKWLRGVE